MLGDVGGLLDGLQLIGSIFMLFFRFISGNPLQAHLLKALFKYRIESKVRDDKEEIALLKG